MLTYLLAYLLTYLLTCQAEAVGRALIENAKEAGITGTVHIANPSFDGFRSQGVCADGTVLWNEGL